MRLPRYHIGTAVLCVIACWGCDKQDSIRVDFKFNTQHQIPGDSTILQGARADRKDTVLYIVLAYGRQRELQTQMDHVLVGGRRVDIPEHGKVYVIGPDLQLHKVSVAPERLVKPMYEGGADEFYESAVWEDELYPLLKKHTWSGSSTAVP